MIALLLPLSAFWALLLGALLLATCAYGVGWLLGRSDGWRCGYELGWDDSEDAAVESAARSEPLPPADSEESPWEIVQSPALRAQRAAEAEAAAQSADQSARHERIMAALGAADLLLEDLGADLARQRRLLRQRTAMPEILLWAEDELDRLDPDEPIPFAPTAASGWEARERALWDAAQAELRDAARRLRPRPAANRQPGEDRRHVQ